MSEMSNEQISALMDDEVDSDARSFLLRRMADDEAFRDRWARYHLISEALKNNISDRTDPLFAERVRHAVAEQAPLAGRTAVTRSRQATHRWRRPAVGLAAAASLAALAVMGLQTGTEPSTDGGALVASLPDTTPSVKSVAFGGSQDQMIQRLQPYVQDHNGHAAHSPMRGSVPYVRLVSHSVKTR